MSTWLIALLSISYLGILFFLAAWAEKKKVSNKRLINNPFIYALSLAIYCSAWTFYGSVGQVSTNGISFLTVYLGPTLVMVLAWGFVRKMVRISKIHHITNMADFVSTRFGKDNSLGLLITVISVVAGIPYIGLQLKAISQSFDLITNNTSNGLFYQDPSFLLFIAITLFILTLGPRKFNSSEKHEGMIFAISVESIIKLIAFLAIGIYITYVIHSGWDDIIQQAKAPLPSIQNQGGYGNWFIQLVICGVSFLFLPRVFHVAIVEINEEENLKQASWLFPLYMVLINLLVIPLGYAGYTYLHANGLNSDLYLLGLPLHFSSKFLAIIVYIGGFSAATGMVIMETIAISSMISNNLFMPLLLRRKAFVQRNQDKLGSINHNLRRLFIVSIMLMAFAHYRISENFVNLVSIGMTSFLIVAQFAPATILGLYWKNGTRSGAIAGIAVGFFISCGLLLLPSLGFSADLFSISGFNPTSNAGYWSLSLNTFTFLSVSILTKQSAKEANQAYLFVDVFNYTQSVENTTLWKGKAKLKDLKNALAGFMGKIKADASLKQFATINLISLQEIYADARIVNYTEKLLAGFVGSTSARLIISAITKEESVGVSEVIDLLQKSRDLQQSNQDLRKLDAQKNEFLTTVTHEIRSPITSIRSLSEIMVDHDDISPEERKKFLDTIIQEADRLSRLVNQVLDLEKLDSGKEKFRIEPVLLEDVIEQATQNFIAIAKQNQVNLIVDLSQKKTPHKVKGDFEKLVQVIINLVSNAIKNVEPGIGKISIRLKENATHICLEIEDNGIGIEPKFHDQIFEKFKQVDNPNRKIESSGLGLSISKKIIEKLHGSIQVQSNLGQGALFLIKLPIEKIAL
jgi:Na+/proline symporter/nitrogen-specific signal transduction histidine kinase